MEKVKFIADLKGFSGCKIKIYSEDRNYFVRKISKDSFYNERLKKQMLKQSPDTVKLTVPLESELDEQLVTLAKLNNRSKSGQVRHLISTAIDQLRQSQTVTKPV